MVMAFFGSSGQFRKLQPAQAWFLFGLLLVAAAAVLSNDVSAVEGCYNYKSIFSFGDSLTDTGNLYFIPPQSPNCLLPPYGETYFHHPNGRIILDFIAESLGLPYVKPYLGFKHGTMRLGNMEQDANFAIAGAAALDHRFYGEKGFAVHTNYTLRVQLDWFKDVLSSLFSSPSRAVMLMVPGNLPPGCNPIYLTRLATTNKKEYDQDGCLKWLNSFFGYHNELLQIELNQLRVLYPHVNIIYADYFNAASQFYHSPEQFGFASGNVLKVCCGGGGPYNTAPCGDSVRIACDDPSQYVNWDGYHPTAAASRWITKGLLDGPYTFPQFTSVSCNTREISQDFNNYAMK